MDRKSWFLRMGRSRCRGSNYFSSSSLTIKRLFLQTDEECGNRNGRRLCLLCPTMSQTISRNDLEDALALFPQIILIEEDIILSSQQEVIHNHPLVATLEGTPHLLASTHVKSKSHQLFPSTKTSERTSISSSRQRSSNHSSGKTYHPKTGQPSTMPVTEKPSDRLPTHLAPLGDNMRTNLEDLVTPTQWVETERAQKAQERRRRGEKQQSQRRC
jgi:hypothetical protein